MLRVWLATALASAGIGLCACSGTTVGGEGDDDMSGGGKGGSAPSKPAATAPQQCKTYVTTRCKKSFGCYVKVGRLPQKDLQYNVDQCIKVIDEGLPCSSVQSTGAGYDSCLKELNGMACSSWDVEPAQFPRVRLPSSCDDAIYF
jgi:hypothetical protein